MSMASHAYSQQATSPGSEREIMNHEDKDDGRETLQRISAFTVSGNGCQDFTCLMDYLITE